MIHCPLGLPNPVQRRIRVFRVWDVKKQQWLMWYITETTYQSIVKQLNDKGVELPANPTFILREDEDGRTIEAGSPDPFITVHGNEPPVR